MHIKRGNLNLNISLKPCMTQIGLFFYLDQPIYDLEWNLIPTLLKIKIMNVKAIHSLTFT